MVFAWWVALQSLTGWVLCCFLLPLAIHCKWPGSRESFFRIWHLHYTTVMFKNGSIHTSSVLEICRETIENIVMLGNYQCFLSTVWWLQQLPAAREGQRDIRKEFVIAICLKVFQTSPNQSFSQSNVAQMFIWCHGLTWMRWSFLPLVSLCCWAIPIYASGQKHLLALGKSASRTPHIHTSWSHGTP